MDFAKLEQALSNYGLLVRGGFNANDEGELPLLSDGRKAQALILVGHGGSSLWPEFSQAPEYLDGEDHALDRWSERIASSLEKSFDVQAVYPFIGPPYRPFLTWAQRAEAQAVLPSRLGMSIHPNYGLWHAYRFAFLAPLRFAEFQQSKPQTLEHDLSGLCKSCDTSPCLSACPVKAFSESGYDVQACVDYLKVTPEAACHTDGCLARKACPIGSDYQYNSPHAAFHMKAFLRARLAE